MNIFESIIEISRAGIIISGTIFVHARITFPLDNRKHIYISIHLKLGK